MRVMPRAPPLLWLLAMAMVLLVLTAGSAVHGQGLRRLVETTHAVAVEPIATTKAPTDTTPPLKETYRRRRRPSRTRPCARAPYPGRDDAAATAVTQSADARKSGKKPAFFI